MSTSLLYHAFGLQGYTHARTEYFGGEVHFTLEQPRKRLRCATCGNRRVVRRGGRWRRFRGLPIGRRPVWLHLHVPRVGCKDCGAVRQVDVAFAPGERRYTKRFARHVIELSKLMSMWDVAQHLGVSWGLVKEIVKSELSRRFGRPRLRDLRHIAIDEIAIGRQHDYLTVVLDLDTGAVVFVGEGKGADALDPFWRRLKQSGARIEAVATDMSPAYVGAVRRHLPEAELVFDRFHVVRLMNDKLSDIRRELQREADRSEKDVLKGTRWLLVRGSENLEGREPERQRLERALELNAPLAVAYYLKEDLRQLWAQPSKEVAARFLEGWIERARASGLRQLRQMAETLSLHREGLLAHYDFPISTGPLEGTNTKIQLLKRQAFGFRDRAFFKLRIYALHEARFSFVG